MDRHLPAELSQYYTDVNRHLRIFSNGMNQNQLVDEMAFVGNMNFGAGQLTKAIKGQRPLSDNQLYIFGKVLGLNEEQLWRLYHASAKDLCARKGLEIDIATAPPVINILIRNAERITETIDAGAFTLAIRMLADLYVSRTELEDSESSAPPLLRVLSMAELEKSELISALASTPYEGLEDGHQLVFVESADVPTIEEMTGTIKLTDIEREFWQSNHVRGLSVKEIADLEGLTEGTVLSVLESAREQIVRHLASEAE